jgi:ABC-2 type transport system ATP-binding protein
VSEAAPIIETRALTRRFGGKLALDGLDLRLDAGRIHAIVGANGAGKSTLFRVLLGFLPATSGEARVLGSDSRALTPADRGRIGIVGEEHALPAWMRVDALVRMQRRHYPRWQEATFRELLGHFQIEPRQVIAQLSRGERAGLSLALALAQAPELLILDEPTLGLDVVAKRALLEALLETTTSSPERCTIVYCSHQMDEIERLAENLVVLERGRLVCTAEPEELCARVRLWLADIPFRGPDPAKLPGLLEARQIDNVFHYLVLDQGDDFAEVLRQAGALTVRSMSVSLTRAVDALLARRHAGRAEAAHA